ncbi:beta-alanine-activating enzyme beta-propeller domain-containing protein [Halorubrum cibi]|uniref:Outer membrane protein assembly factor BamB, contains PQQ-like beta-propeller repeat n=1 Tax=Halorubrum cibi TaxID=413815 RepID=A0A521EJQ7_9EURY|nr:PQQ-binding-like beta-propeller repeat protein [Halorubrum cibi]SMO84145.1 Outer membrane protein assembly factor BamB, contains PQQ-like beta-propeller repeat [Halorubrum cibi]
MRDSPGSGRLRANRRRVLRTVGGLTTLGILGTGAPTVAGDPGDELWVFETNGAIESSATVVDNTVFVTSSNGNLYAVDIETGNQQWVFEIGVYTESSSTVVDDTVFVGGTVDTFDILKGTGRLYAVDAETGNQQWAFETTSQIGSSPTVVDGTVFVGDWDSNLYAVDAETGEQRWSFETGGAIQSSPTVSDGSVFVGSLDRNLYVVDAETGEEQWAFGTDGTIRSSPTVSGGSIFVGSTDGNLYAVDSETGEEQWAFETGEGIFSSPTVSGDSVFVGSDGGNLYAVDAETGEQQWNFKADYGIYSSPTVVEDIVLVGYRDNLYAVDAETGDQQWAFETGSSIHSSPTVVDGTAFVGSDGGNLYAIDTGLDGSSEGSRVLLGTLGHHGDWRYADQSIDIPAYALYASWVRNNVEWLTIGGVGIGGIAGGGYLFRRRRKTQQSDQESPEESSSKPSSTPSSETDPSTTPTEESETDGSSKVDELRSEAETALETAVFARANDEFDEAADAYSEALIQYRAALDELDAGATETRAEIEESIDSTRGELATIQTRNEQRDDLREVLRAAERSFQVGIVAYAQASRTLARIRFRQARDSFEEAIDILQDGDDDLLTSSVEVSVQPDRELVSTTLSELPMIPDAETAALTDAGIETLGELESSEEPPWLPAAVETLVTEETTNDGVATTLTLLSWWNDADSYEFDTEEAVSRRREQSEYGFAQSS